MMIPRIISAGLARPLALGTSSITQQRLFSRGLCSAASSKIRVSRLESNSSVLHVQLSNPAKMNSLDLDMWTQFKSTFESIGRTEGEFSDVKAVVLSGEGKHFCTGMDVTAFSKAMQTVLGSDCPAKGREYLFNLITHLQECVTVLEKCPVPVVGAVQGACLGGAVDMVCATDLCVASPDAVVCVKEVDIAIAADMGTLQRLASLVGQRVANDWAMTARKVTADEATRSGFFNRIVDDPLQEAIETACLLASKPSSALRGTKRALVYARDHSVEQSLEQIATWNSATMLSNDLLRIAASMAQNKNK